MNLTFKVLWIDDVPQYVVPMAEALKKVVTDEGFKLEVDFVKTGNEAFEKVALSVYNDGIDLIVVDHDLGTDQHGDDVIKEIRRRIPHRTIVFYSAKSVADLQEVAYRAKVDGIYCSSRVELAEVLIDCFQGIVVRHLDIDTCRGIVMGVTAHIDDLVKRCLLILGSVLKMDQQKLITSKFIVDKVERSEKSDKALKKKYFEGGMFSELLDEKRPLTSFDQLRLLLKALEKRDDSKSSGAISRIKDYMEMLEHRNSLAHSDFEAEGTTPDQHDVRENRIRLVKHLESFECIHTGLATDDYMSSNDS